MSAEELAADRADETDQDGSEKVLQRIFLPAYIRFIRAIRG